MRSSPAGRSVPLRQTIQCRTRFARNAGYEVRSERRTQARGEVDNVLRNPKLRRLHECLADGLNGYVGLGEAGSTTAGDPWVKGRSDRDIAIVLAGKIDGHYRQRIQRQLGRLRFGDVYLFYVMHERRFMVTHSDQDISMKFRGQMLFGQDLITQKDTPEAGVRGRDRSGWTAHRGPKVACRHLERGILVGRAPQRQVVRPPQTHVHVLG